MDKQEYAQIYDRGLPYFDTEHELVVASLMQKQCVALCSAYKMGDRRFIDYLYHTIAHDDRFDVYYDKENTFTPTTLEKIQRTVTKRIKVVLLPWYFRMSPDFQQSYLSIMRNKNNSFVSIIVLEPSFLDHPELLFPNTNTPMERILTRLPLDKTRTGQLLDIRCQLAGLTLSETQRARITNLSGGHIGLIKRLFNLAIQGSDLTKQVTLEDPAIKADLLNLELQYRTLTQATNKRIGILKDDLSVAIPLLRYFIDSITTSLTDTLSPLYQQLLTLFLSKNGGIVTKDEIHQIMNQEQEYSLWAVYKNISRFAKSIEKKYLIKNISGKGYLLVQRQKNEVIF